MQYFLFSVIHSGLGELVPVGLDGEERPTISAYNKIMKRISLEVLKLIEGFNCFFSYFTKPSETDSKILILLQF